jgi:hypothetical protein
MLFLAALALAAPCLGLTAVDVLSAPRPQAPILSPERDLALNIVDQWDPELDQYVPPLFPLLG